MRRSPRTLRASALALAVPVLALGLLAVVAPARNSVLAAAPSLHVSGNHVVDAGGNTVVLHGVNRSGGEFACVQGTGIWDGPMDQASIDAMKTWGVNAVRIPLNEACWNAESYVNAAYAGATYQAAVQSYVNLLGSNGMVAILDLHWTDGLYTGSSAGCSNATATCQKPMPDAAQAVPFWTSVATMFKGNGAVVFDLFNEPYPERATGNETTGWQCWRDGGTCSGIGYPVAGMQTLVNAIRGTGATNIIELGGLAYSNDETAWLTYKPTDTANNLVASWHTYNFNSCSNTSCFDSQLAPVIASVPLVAGEIGENDCGSSYITTVMNWLDSHGTGYLGWTWNTWDCSSGPSLISDYTGTATAYGAGYKAHLLALPNQSPTPTRSPTPTVQVTCFGGCQTPSLSPSPPPTAPRTATPPPTGGVGTCSAGIHVDNSWGTGFQATVTVTAGSSAITSWKVTWSWPSSQSITNYWNAAVTSSGAAVTANNLSYNGSLAAGGNTTFGIQVNGSSATPTLSCAANGSTASPTPIVSIVPPPVTPSPTPIRTASPTPVRTATPPPPTPTPIRTASPTPVPPTPTPVRTPSPTPGTAKSCSASFHVDNSWGTGFQATVTVTNTGTSATAGWTVTITWPSGQTIANSWNAAVTSSGSTTTAKNLSYNGVLPPGGSTTFGLQVNGAVATPTLTCTAS